MTLPRLASIIALGENASAGILHVLLKARPIRIGVTACAVAAMLALSMLPAEHLHASDAERPVVHRHVIGDAAEHADSSVDHPDHWAVQTLDPTFHSERQYAVRRPLITVEPVLVVPDRRFAGRVEPLDAVMTHGPPIRVRSLRAPPA